jgi:hypothetical protein
MQQGASDENGGEKLSDRRRIPAEGDPGEQDETDREPQPDLSDPAEINSV